MWELCSKFISIIILFQISPKKLTKFFIRPGKVDSLFPISHFLNFNVDGRLLFIIHYEITIYLILQCILIFFYIEKLQTQIQEITNQLQMFHLKQIQVIQLGAFHKD